MSSVKMTAMRQISGDYGDKVPGDQFETTEDVAKSLEERGLAARGHKKLTDSVLEKANETRVENEQAKVEEKTAAAEKAAGPAENKSVSPAENKSSAKK